MAGAMTLRLGMSPPPVVSLSDRTVTDNDATAPSAQYRLQTDGQVRTSTVSGGLAFPETWIEPTSAAGSAYEVRATVTSGTFTSGTAGSWLSLGSIRNWTCDQATDGTKTVTATFEIRNATSLAVLTTATITLTANNT